MFHSILDSLLIFGALHRRDAPFGYARLAGLVLDTTMLLNVVGGLAMVTLLRLVRSKELLQQERAAVDAEG